MRGCKRFGIYEAERAVAHHDDQNTTNVSYYPRVLKLGEANIY